MTATTTMRLKTAGATDYPARATVPVAADTLLFKHTIVSLDADGNAAEPTDGDGFPALGIATSTIDNRVGSMNGGTAGAVDVEILYGVYGFAYTGSAPKVGDRLYVVDNQTLSTSPGSGRGFAGVAVFLQGGQVFCLFSPLAKSQAESIDVDQLEDDVAALASAALAIPVPTQPAFADGTTNGFDASAFGFRFNNTIDNQFMYACVGLPATLDADEDVVVRVQAKLTDDSVDNDVTLLMAARFDAGSDVAVTSATVVTDAAGGVQVEFTIPAASVPAGAHALFMSFRFDNNLDTADGVIYGGTVNFTRTLG